MISVIIPSYRNKKMLIKNLNNNMQFFKNLEVIVINDYPEESLKKELKKFKIILIENDRNLGFGQSVNKGVIKATNNLILILNSDVVINNNNFISSTEYFKEHKKAFAVAFAQKGNNNSLVGKNKIYWKYGFIRHKSNKDLTYGVSSWAEGGASMLDRDKFIKLGGFDELFTPFYWEDIDLSYRAWKSGYEIIFDPKIIVNHNHESTISNYFNNEYIKTISYRNQFIFIWKNILNIRLLFEHIILLIPNSFYFFIKGEFSFFKGFFNAVYKLFEILNHRKKQKTFYILKDIEVLKKFK